MMLQTFISSFVYAALSLRILSRALRRRRSVRFSLLAPGIFIFARLRAVFIRAIHSNVFRTWIPSAAATLGAEE